MTRPTPLHDALLVAWFALISADRIDFFGGSGPFILTPFLILTPLVLLSEAARAGLRGRGLAWSRSASRYAVVTLALLSLVLLSVLLGLDVATSGKRAAHLFVLVLSTFAVALGMMRRAGAERILVRGAKVGLVLAVAFSVSQLSVFLSDVPETVRVGFATINLSTPAYAGWIPRLSGQVADMNRAGFLLVFYVYVLMRWAAPGVRKRMWIGVALSLLVLTLSRSALLALGAAALVAALEGRGTRISRPTAATLGAALAAAAVWMLLDPLSLERVGSGLEPLLNRFSLAEGSARSHLDLLGRGVVEAAASLERAVTGIGYGNSYLVLQDVFPGNKYGNFHSLYVSFLAESGVFAFLLIVVLVVYPLLRGGPVRPLIAGVAAYNVFYQASAEPLLWFILAWAWLTVPVPRPAGPAADPVSSADEPAEPLPKLQPASP